MNIYSFFIFHLRTQMFIISSFQWGINISNTRVNTVGGPQFWILTKNTITEATQNAPGPIYRK